MQLLGPDIELHHSVMHNKPPGGQPFPMHQDHPFYPHDDGRYADVLIHLDDTCHENGEIRFLPGSHKQGPLPHILGTEEEPSAPHLPTDRYRLADSVAVPAQRGDVVVFSYYTVHGSYINATDRTRRMVRVGYRHPHNGQHQGVNTGTPGIMGCRLPRAPRRRTTAGSYEGLSEGGLPAAGCGGQAPRPGDQFRRPLQVEAPFGLRTRYAGRSAGAGCALTR